MLNFSFSHGRHNFRLDRLLRKSEKSRIGRNIHFLNPLFKRISKTKFD